jgi:hypothetical protein
MTGFGRRNNLFGGDSMFSGKLDGLETAEPRQEMGCGDAPDRLSRILVRWVLTPLAGLWCGFLVVTWLPTYLTWPWYTDSEHFAVLARLWDSGGLPYRDMFSTQFPGEIYLHWLLGKLLGWGNTVAYYAVDAALVIAFGALLVLWGRRRVGSALPGWIGFSTFLLYYWTLAKREEKQSTMSIFCPMERGRRTRRREPRVVALNNRPIEPEPPPELKARGFPS